MFLPFALVLAALVVEVSHEPPKSEPVVVETTCIVTVETSKIYDTRNRKWLITHTEPDTVCYTSTVGAF